MRTVDNGTRIGDLRMIILSLIVLLMIAIILLAIGFIIGVVRISVDLKIIKDRGECLIKIYVWKMKIMTFDIPEFKLDPATFNLKYKSESEALHMKNEDEKTIDESDVKTYLDRHEKLIDIIKNFDLEASKFIKSINIYHIKWYTACGIGDANHTGMLMGLIWSLKGFLMGFTTRYVNVPDQPLLDIQPAYNHWTFQTHFRCIISFQLRKAISLLLKTYKDAKRRRSSQCQNIQSKV